MLAMLAMLFSEQDSNWTGETNLSGELMTEEGWLNKLRTMENLDSTEAKKHVTLGCLSCITS